MIGKEIDEKKTKYFVIAIIILIILSVLLVVHFNNKSLVNGNEDVEPKVTTTTTTKKTTTKVKKDKIKVNNVVNTPSEEIKEEVLEKEEDVYKTTIDEDNKLIYNYKLSDEITSTDVIKSEVLNIDEDLKTQNIIKLYDISLFDVDNIKKSVKNTNITISIPVTKDIEEYEDFKVVYIDENNKITEEEFETVVENGYIKFTTTHLSKFGIIGTKKIDFSKVTLDIKINDEAVNVLNDIYVSTEDKIYVLVNNLDDDYKLSYLLMNEDSNNKYQSFNKDMFSLIETPSKYTLIIKIEVGNNEKVFEIGKFNVYDIVFNYDSSLEVEEDIVIGEIVSEDGTDYNYEDKEINKDIVILNKEEVIEEEIDKKPEKEEIKEETETTDEILENDEVEETDEIVSEGEDNPLENNNDIINSETETDIENTLDDNVVDNEVTEDLKESEEIEDELEDKATIKVNGNIYLIEKTDISNLEMTGHLIIDTSEDITFATLEDKLLTSNLYTITIKSKEFSLNGVKYTYEYVEDKLVITKVEDNTEVENFEDMFDGFEINKEEKNDLVLETYTK